MKIKTILILLLIVASIKTYSQNNNEFRIYYGFVDSELLRSKDLVGSAEYKNNNSYEFGVKYLRKISKNLSIETGINFLNTKVKITPSLAGTPVSSRQEDLKLVSIPIYANYSI